MELLLKRTTKTKLSTIGELYVNGVFQCYTLEDIERNVKIKGVTAIPKGSYKVIVTMSNRFKKPLPLLLDVPNFSGVRIHSGNKSEDTEGCILVGETKQTDFIGGSRIAFKSLFDKINKAVLSEEIILTIQ